MLIPMYELTMHYINSGYFYEVKEENKSLFHTDFSAMFLSSKVGYSLENYTQLPFRLTKAEKQNTLLKGKEFFQKAESFDNQLLDCQREYFTQELQFSFPYGNTSVHEPITGRLHLFSTENGIERWVDSRYILSPKLELYVSKNSVVSDGIALRYQDSLIGFVMPCIGRYSEAKETTPIIEDVLVPKEETVTV